MFAVVVEVTANNIIMLKRYSIINVHDVNGVNHLQWIYYHKFSSMSIHFSKKLENFLTATRSTV